MSETNPVSPASDPPLRGGRPQRLRWLVPPVIAVVLVAVVGLVPKLAGAQGRPKLGPISAAALIAKVQIEAPKVSALSGTVQFKPNLGLPDLSALTSGASGPQAAGSSGEGPGSGGASGTQAATTSLVTSLLTTTQTAQVYIDGPEHVRVALAQGQGEADLIRNGTNLWMWQSKSQHVTHAVLPAHGSGPSDSATPAVPSTSAIPPTPQAVASHILSSLDPSTRVFVLDTAYVAGRSAYELVLAPKSPQSLISDVIIAVDSATGLPLRVQVVSRSSTTPALELGYTSINLARPAASNFAFTPPPGAKVDTVAGDKHRAPGAKMPLAGTQAKTSISTSAIGTGWDSIGVIKGVDLANRQLATLLHTATPVGGSFGSGLLLTTSVVDALVLPNGTVLVGAVTPQALESAAVGLS